MKAILELLKDNEALAGKLRTAESVDAAAKILAEAAAEADKQVDVGEIKKFLQQRPKPSEQLSEKELMSVAGGALPKKTDLCSIACCATCPHSQIIY